MKYLVTGGSGFLGKELISRLDCQVVTVSRNEGELIKLKSLHPDISIIPGDIADELICKKAMVGVDVVFHLAAFKHVGLAEDNAAQCINSNIIGTRNLLEQSLIDKPKTFVFISTDKASQISGVYGATKFLCEKLIEEYSGINKSTDYKIVRYGNVFGSTGSFITKWVPLMSEGKEVQITDLDATRFFWSVSDAVDFIFHSMTSDKLLNIPDIRGVSMGTVLDACMSVYGKSPVRTIGLGNGENKHETLGGLFSNEVQQYTREEFVEEFLSGR